MLGRPQKIGVAEKRNRTLVDMVRSMLSDNTIPLSLRIHALKTVAYLLNRVPSKAVSKTPYELWTRRKSSLRHLNTWGSLVEIRIYNPHEKKLSARTVNGYFIGYLEKSKGYIFYCPNHNIGIVESGNARFIENGQTSGTGEPRKVDVQETWVETFTPSVSPPVVAPLVVPRFYNMLKQQRNVLNPLEHVNEEPANNEQAINEQMIP